MNDLMFLHWSRWAAQPIRLQNALAEILLLTRKNILGCMTFLDSFMSVPSFRNTWKRRTCSKHTSVLLGFSLNLWQVVQDFSGSGRTLPGWTISCWPLRLYWICISFWKLSCSTEEKRRGVMLQNRRRLVGIKVSPLVSWCHSHDWLLPSRRWVQLHGEEI